MSYKSHRILWMGAVMIAATLASSVCGNPPAASLKEDAAYAEILTLHKTKDLLIKTGDLDGAERMFRFLIDRYPHAFNADAGPVGLGRVMLARKQPQQALGIFDKYLTHKPPVANQPLGRHWKEAMLGKLQALVDLGQWDAATKLALELVGDKEYRGESSARAYLLLAQVYRKQAAALGPGQARDLLLQRALAYYQRVYLTTAAYPDLCAEAYWEAFEIAKELKNAVLAEEILKALRDHPKLRDTEPAKKARELPK